ncbi:UDP-N-acetylglucosamine 2-epimerase (non-hydrolyzing) [Acidothermaceae bacterium B102]|nr:UDP-N-acetylglucosamine 2-epimerase (non-hydrolyzing) [Acidothermaceae bacterium B102]
MSPLRLTVPVGTRPEVIKLAPVVHALRAAGHEVRCVATGQHYDARMYGDVFAGLGLVPDDIWTLQGTEGERLGQLLSAAFAELAAHPTDAVLVLGDTYTAPLVAIAARRYGIGVIHLEAGLRSQNGLSVEEVNRKMMVGLATVHLAPTTMAAAFLAGESVPSSIVRVVGNPVVDAVVAMGIPVRPLTDRRGVLLTAHRATNVDSPGRLAELVSLVRGLATAHGPVLFPMHPRTRDRLVTAGRLDELLATDGLDIVDPLPYASLLTALSTSAIAVTDSGGLQEEAAYFGVPAVVMRNSTPRWEGVAAGTTVLTGMDSARVLAAVARMTTPSELARIADVPCPYGDGTTGAQVVAALDELRSLITPTEPSYDPSQRLPLALTHG